MRGLDLKYIVKTLDRVYFVSVQIVEFQNLDVYCSFSFLIHYLMFIKIFYNKKRIQCAKGIL